MVVSDYPVTPREKSYLGLPAFIRPGKFVAENKREAFASDFVVDINSVHFCFGHNISPWFNGCF
jgi:hypothetical protein